MPTVQLSKGPALLVELAKTPAERARGLQWRYSLPENYGMLFCFPTERIQTFTMRNTPLSLDLLFFNSNGILVGFFDHTTPLSHEHLACPVRASYVLEVHAGWRTRHGVAIGDRMFFRDDWSWGDRRKPVVFQGRQ